MMAAGIKTAHFSERDRADQKTAHGLELAVWALLLLVCNLPLWSGRIAKSLVFFPGLVAGGQWWRLVLFPLVHVSWYHLILDAGAFLLLWKGIDEARWRHLAACWAGSLLMPLCLSASVGTLGLCGLSGICHGLMAISALETAVSQSSPCSAKIGLALFFGLGAKVCWEVLSGAAFLADLHLGAIGIPIVSSHLGGFLGGLSSFVLLYLARLLKNNENQLTGLPEAGAAGEGLGHEPEKNH
ncbi:MAG: rhomboid family intramembrane serine protease [Deltaproteobacteria bacterium]|nr:rhomboid family intramembrane serine protease [Deltaproteobacteria bacterium]